MDKPRPGAARKRLIRRIVIGVVLLITIPMITWALSRLKPAAPSVDRATVIIDSVKRGSMLRQVRGLGTLVPEEVLLIPAVTDGRIEKIILRPGIQLRPDSVIMVLKNPDVELAAVDLEWQVKAAEATYRDLKVKLETQTLDQRQKITQTQAEHTKAKLQSDRDVELLKNGLTADITVKQSRASAEDLETRVQMQLKALEILKDSIEAQLAVQQVQIEKLKAAYALKRRQVEQLQVRAGVEGTLQEIKVEVGQQVTAGTQLAKMAQPRKLKAELKIPETQAKDVIIGQRAEVDTRNGVIEGRVSRIDPAVLNGTVTVDVKLEGPLPDGARPDLSVDGTIELERLTDVLYVGRPVFGQNNAKVTLFKLQPDGKEAERVPVQLGRMSVTNVEIVSGLKVGDQVVLSDMSTWDAQNRIRLN